MEKININIKHFDPTAGSGTGRYYEENVRFFGEEVAVADAFGVQSTLYYTPSGYRIVEEDRNGRTERVELKPYTGGPFPPTSRAYGYLTQAQVVAGFPLFAPHLSGYRDV